jgi:IS5 family transposase
LHADKAYDSAEKRKALRQQGITPRIARRGIESSERLGRYRWVVERTQAWINRFRRLKVRYERRSDIHLAFLHLGCALICWHFMVNTCC